MKRYACLIFVFVLPFVISGCYANWTPPEFWNIEISPTTVKRGDEITITYDTRYPGEGIESLFIDKDGNLLLSEEYKNSHDEYTFEDNYNDFVSFNTKIPEDATKYEVDDAKNCTSMDFECGKEKIVYDYSDYDLAFIHPAKYVSSEFGKIVCVVPDNAVSGVIFLSYMNAQGLSGEKLIVVDENGKEITE